MNVGWKDQSLIPLGYGFSERDINEKAFLVEAEACKYFNERARHTGGFAIAWGSKEVRVYDTRILSNETSRHWKKTIKRDKSWLST